MIKCAFLMPSLINEKGEFPKCVLNANAKSITFDDLILEPLHGFSVTPSQTAMNNAQIRTEIEKYFANFSLNI